MAEIAVSREARARKRPFMTQRRREAMYGYLFAAPFLIGFLWLTLGPMLFSLYVSFTDYDIVNSPHWVGMKYYNFIFQHDPQFRIALGNTLWYVIVKTPIVLSVALFLAILMNQRVPFVKIFRTIFYMPTVITGVAAIFLWIWVLSPYGILNRGLNFLHLQSPTWFYDPHWTKPGMIVMSTWYIGSPMLILLAGLAGVPKHLYEAAEIDGAGMFRKFWNITLPMLSPTVFFLVITNIIGAFQIFNSAYIISSTIGGAGSELGYPQQSLLFYEVYLYSRFHSLEMGFASALAWILFVIVLIITLIQLYLARRWVHYES